MNAFQTQQTGTFEELSRTFVQFMPNSRIVTGADWKGFCWSGEVSAMRGRSMWRVRINRDIAVRAVETPEFFSLIVPRAGAAAVTVRGVEHVAVPGQALVLNAPGERDTRALCSGALHERVSLKWHRAEWEHIAASLFGNKSIEEIELAPRIHFSDGAGAVFFPLLNAVIHDLADRNNDLGLASVLMNEALLRLVLERSSTEAHRPFEDAAKALVPRNVRRAVEFMRANVGNPITIADVATACRVTTRTLESGFRAHLDISPQAYLRMIRLEEVRKQLVSGGDAASISAVARRWGFVDMGRFSARYRQAFGELPSQTLRRR